MRVATGASDAKMKTMTPPAPTPPPPSDGAVPDDPETDSRPVYDDDEYDDDEYDDGFTPDEEAILDLLHIKLAEGPATMAEVVAAIRHAGLVPANATEPGDDDATGEAGDREEPDELDELVLDLLQADEGFWFSKGMIDSIARRLDGTVFTHRITADELALGKLLIETDLCIADFGLQPMVKTGPPAADEGVTLDHWNDTYGLSLPATLTASLRAGDLIGVRRHGSAIEVAAVDHTGPGTAEIEAVRRELQILVDEGMGDEPTSYVMDALVAEPSLFAEPVPPLSELLTRSGLMVADNEVGPSDQIWHRLGFERHLIDRAEASYELDACCLDALWLVARRWRAVELDMTDRADAPTIGATIEALGHGDVGPALADVIDTDERDARHDQFRAFADELLAAAAELPNGERAIGPRLLVAYLAERAGDTTRAEALYHKVLDQSPGSPAAVEGLSQIAFDRSDFLVAARLLRRIYDGADAQVRITEELAASLLTAGRNDPCPCGSGRKYKACHSGQSLVAPRERINVLLTKLAKFAVSRPRRDELTATAWHHLLDPDALLSDRLLFDAYLLNPTNADAYRRLRGQLLPADDHDLLDRLTEAPLQLVELVEPGNQDASGARVLRSATTGERLDCELPADFALEVGQMALVRLLDGRLMGQVTIMPPESVDDARALVADGPPTLDRLLWWYSEGE
jgi:SEC-C motif